MGVYAIYVVSPEYVDYVVKDVLRLGGKIISVSKLFGIVNAEVPDEYVTEIMKKEYVRMVEKSYPFGHM